MVPIAAAALLKNLRRESSMSLSSTLPRDVVELLCRHEHMLTSFWISKRYYGSKRVIHLVQDGQQSIGIPQRPISPGPNLTLPASITSKWGNAST
jgi:hypothetical protein